jgi:hypothetical protein
MLLLFCWDGEGGVEGVFWPVTRLRLHRVTAHPRLLESSMIRQSTSLKFNPAQIEMLSHYSLTMPANNAAT